MSLPANFQPANSSLFWVCFNDKQKFIRLET